MKDWSDDARLTAHALGELDARAAAELERELAGDPDGRRELAELRATAALLSAELAREAGSPEALSEAARAAITARASAPRAGRARGLRRAAVVLAGGLAAAAAVALAWPRLATELQGSADEVASAPRETAPPATEARRVETTLARYEQAEGQPTVPPGSGGAAPGAVLGETLTVEELNFLKKMGYSGDPAMWSELRGLGYVGGAEFDDLDALEREGYARIAENAFKSVAEDPLSTFAIDVDTASYANVRRFLAGGQLPPADAVRIEELLNYFAYDYPLPAPGEPLSITVEAASAPWAPQHRLVRIGLRGTEIPVFEPREKNLVFLIDVSGSMSSPDKLPLLKRALRLLVENLSGRDRVAIVIYAGSSGVALETTPADRKDAILAAIERLEPGGSTHGSQGIELAYWLAERSRAEGGVNRVVLCTDGDFNVGVTNEEALVELIEEKRARGVSLSVLGFGTGNLQDAKMEALADHGNGNYAYVDTLAEARKVLVHEMGATLETIAKDVKLQVAFDPASAASFRLIGYENRLLEHEDFEDDTKDAGEVGAGHRVTALYEVVPAPGFAPGAHLLDVRLRFQPPDGGASRLIEVPLRDAGRGWREASDDLRFAAAVAGFGMVLRGSEHRGGLDLFTVLELAASGSASDPFGYRQEFLRLVKTAINLAPGHDQR